MIHSLRDRSIVTAAIARNQTSEMPGQFRRALDNGVKPGELSEMITHLAFYSGWGNATTAVAVAEDVFAERRIGPDQLPKGVVELLPLDEAAEAQRAASVSRAPALSLRASSTTPARFSSATCGCSRAWRRGTGAW
jgi:4-carboxymuconolactone decarboxylase